MDLRTQELISCWGPIERDVLDEISNLQLQRIAVEEFGFTLFSELVEQRVRVLFNSWNDHI